METMKLMKKQMWVGLLCTALAAGTAVRAEDAAPKPENPPTAQKKATGPTAYEGKVVVVDKRVKTFTVEIDRQLYLFKPTAQTRLERKGKPVVFKDLAAGQEITLVIQQDAGGPIELVSVSIQGSGSAFEAAGGSNHGIKPLTN